VSTAVASDQVHMSLRKMCANDICIHMHTYAYKVEQPSMLLLPPAVWCRRFVPGAPLPSPDTCVWWEGSTQRRVEPRRLAVTVTDAASVLDAAGDADLQVRQPGCRRGVLWPLPGGSDKQLVASTCSAAADVAAEAVDGCRSSPPRRYTCAAEVVLHTGEVSRQPGSTARMQHAVSAAGSAVHVTLSSKLRNAQDSMQAQLLFPLPLWRACSPVFAAVLLPLQTPTLGFCVERHQAIVSFQPEPFWVVRPMPAKVNPDRPCRCQLVLCQLLSDLHDMKWQHVLQQHQQRHPPLLHSYSSWY